MKPCKHAGCGKMAAADAFIEDESLEKCSEHHRAAVIERLGSENGEAVFLRVKHVQQGVFVAMFMDGGVLTENVVLLPPGSKGKSRCFNMQYEPFVWSGRIRKWELPKPGESCWVSFERTQKKRLPVKTRQEVEGTSLF